MMQVVPVVTAEQNSSLETTLQGQSSTVDLVQWETVPFDTIKSRQDAKQRKYISKVSVGLSGKRRKKPLFYTGHSHFSHAIRAPSHWAAQQHSPHSAINEQAPMFASETNLGTHIRLDGSNIRDGEEDGIRGMQDTALALLKQYEHSGGPERLSRSIQLWRQTLAMLPRSHPDYSISLDSLGVALRTHFSQSGEVDSLTESMRLHHEALALRPEGHPGRSTVLNNLGLVLWTQYDRNGNTDTLTESINLHREALALQPQGHPERSDSLDNLALALWTQYDQSGSADALTESIRLHHEALALRPQGHPRRSDSLNNLALAIWSRYEQSGDTSVLTESIRLHHEALSLRPQGHPQRSDSLNNLALALSTKYEQSSDADALTESIRLHREALALRPQGHPDRHVSLTNLATALWMQHRQIGEADVLLEGICLQRESLPLRPPNHPDRRYPLSNLATALWTYYTQSGDMGALIESMQLQREVLALGPQGHPGRSTLLNNLATALNRMYTQHGDIAALKESINLHHQALTLEPLDYPSPQRSLNLRNLCLAYISQYHLYRNEDILSTALTLTEELLEAGKYGHHDRQETYHIVARIRLIDSSHRSLVKALEYLGLAVTDVHVAPRHRLELAISSLYLVERVFIKHSEEKLALQRQLLNLYIFTVELLPLAANYGLTSSTRLRELSGSEQLCHTAAIRATLCGELTLAVQIYEEGKTVFWTQALRMRSSALDALPIDDREMLSNLFHQLESDDGSNKIGIYDRAEIERLAAHRRQLNKQAEALIASIRQRPGFDRFLKIPLFEKLKEAASRGFVIVLVSDERGCFAIVIQAQKPPNAIALDTMNGDGLETLSRAVSHSGMRDWGQTPEISHYEDGPNRVIKTKRVGGHKHHEHQPLSEMWHAVVKPVIDYLGLQKAQGRNRPRVHWCPSGKLASLPLHAAGIYEGETRNRVSAADYIVSSYTPSLSAVIRAREGFVAIRRQELRAALYADSGGHGGHALIPEVKEEVQKVAEILTSNSVAVDMNVNSTSTVDSMFEHTMGAHILHLACHGQQQKNPLESSFALKNPLTISALMRLDLKIAMLAYLSACETAKGDDQQPDQAVHLAASMLFCGFRSIVATMWTMNDKDGPKMTEWFYNELVKNEVVSLDDIPYALDAAVRGLRKLERPARYWATYMHLGA